MLKMITKIIPAQTQPTLFLKNKNLPFTMIIRILEYFVNLMMIQNAVWSGFQVLYVHFQ